MITIIVSKKNLKRAVDRNLARRRIRAALDELRPGWRQTLEGKIYATPEMISLPFPELKGKIEICLARFSN